MIYLMSVGEPGQPTEVQPLKGEQVCSLQDPLAGDID